MSAAVKHNIRLYGMRWLTGCRICVGYFCMPREVTWELWWGRKTANPCLAKLQKYIRTFMHSHIDVHVRMEQITQLETSHVEKFVHSCLTPERFKLANALCLYTSGLYKKEDSFWVVTLICGRKPHCQSTHIKCTNTQISSFTCSICRKTISQDSDPAWQKTVKISLGRGWQPAAL